MIASRSAGDALRANWPEYLIEAWALGTFMVSAGVFTTLLLHPGAALVRRALIGIAMGATAMGLIYSPWGRRSGAHMNPSVTLAFLSLGRVAKWDAIFYVCAQFIGGLIGVLAVDMLLGASFATPPVSFIATVPGPRGVAVAFGAELAISFALMLAVLFAANDRRSKAYTGLIAGVLVAAYVAFEAPLSGMSMNPARTLASALPAGIWNSIWIYFTAPLLGMWLAARVFVMAPATAMRMQGCAKLQHTADVRCIHCGHTP